MYTLKKEIKTLKKIEARVKLYLRNIYFLALKWINPRVRVVIKSHYTLENPLFRRVFFHSNSHIIGGIELYFYIWNKKKLFYTKGNKIIENKKKNVNLVLASWISTHNTKKNIVIEQQVPLP